MAQPAATLEYSLDLEYSLLIGDDDEEFNGIIDEIGEIVADNEEPSAKKVIESLSESNFIDLTKEDAEEVEIQTTHINDISNTAGTIETNNATKVVVTSPEQHPFQNLLDNLIYSKDQLEVTVLPLSKSIYSTRLLEIRTQSGLDALVKKLSRETELAVDLVISNRTYLPCVIAILLSTKMDDIFVDVLHLGDVQALNKIFVDQNIVKVFYCHKVTNILKFLQHLKLFPVNIFDIGTAQMVVHKNLKSLSQNLLQRYGLRMENYERGDIFQRPLSSQNRMFYKLQTHFVLNIYHSVKNSLLTISRDVCRRALRDSNDFCKIVFPENDYHYQTNHFRVVEDIKKIHQYQLLLIKKLDNWRLDIAKEHNIHPSSVMTVATMTTMALDVALKDAEIPIYLETQHAKASLDQIRHILNEAKQEVTLPAGGLKTIYNRRVFVRTQSVKARLPPQNTLKPAVSHSNRLIVKKPCEPINHQITLKSQPVKPPPTIKCFVNKSQSDKLIAKSQSVNGLKIPVEPESKLHCVKTRNEAESECNKPQIIVKEDIEPLILNESELINLELTEMKVQSEKQEKSHLVKPKILTEDKLIAPQIALESELITRAVTTAFPELVKHQIEEPVEARLNENPQELVIPKIFVKPLSMQPEVESKLQEGTSQIIEKCAKPQLGNAFDKKQLSGVNKKSVRPKFKKTKQVLNKTVKKTSFRMEETGKSRKRKTKNRNFNKNKKPKFENNRPLGPLMKLKLPQTVQGFSPFINNTSTNNLQSLIKPEILTLAQRLLPLLTPMQGVELNNRPTNSFDGNFYMANNRRQIIADQQPIVGSNYYQLINYPNLSSNLNPDLQQFLTQRLAQPGRWPDDAYVPLFQQPNIRACPYAENSFGGNQHYRSRS